MRRLFGLAGALVLAATALARADGATETCLVNRGFSYSEVPGFAQNYEFLQLKDKGTGAIFWIGTSPHVADTSYLEIYGVPHLYVVQSVFDWIEHVIELRAGKPVEIQWNTTSGGKISLQFDNGNTDVCP